VFEKYRLESILESASNEADIYEAMTHRRITYLLFDDAFLKDPKLGLPLDHLALWTRFIEGYAKRVYANGPYKVHKRKEKLKIVPINAV